MPTTQRPYEFITEKIRAIKDAYPSLRSRSDAYSFSALCIKSSFYKNPALVLNESGFEDMIVDGPYDGGVDILLSDPNTEGADLVIGQSKFYTSIQYDDVLNAMTKMALFYKDMIRGQYEQVNPTVQRRFMTLLSDIGDESKIRFVFYTSAPQSGIHRDRIEKKFREQFTESNNIDVSILFADDLVDEIKESESRRPAVEAGKIQIDKRGNVLLYGDGAAIVNVSAFSIKQLYARHNTNLLARNLRYHVAGRDIDKILEGAAAAEKELAEPDLMKNDCYRYAALRNILYRKGKTTEIFVTYEPAFTMMNEWLKQLYGESEGKDQKGIFPASVTFSTDLHSMGQFIQDGNRTLFETVVDIQKPAEDFFIENDPENLDGLNFLSGQEMSKVNRRALEGTILAHTEGGVPNLVLELPDTSEYEYGYMVYFFEKACAISGYLSGVNPFDQPGVEAYKKNMFALLGKPGYEELRAGLLEKLN